MRVSRPLSLLLYSLAALALLTGFAACDTWWGGDEVAIEYREGDGGRVALEVEAVDGEGCASPLLAVTNAPRPD